LVGIGVAGGPAFYHSGDILVLFLWHWQCFVT